MSLPEQPKKIEIHNAFWALCFMVIAGSLIALVSRINELIRVLERLK